MRDARIDPGLCRPRQRELLGQCQRGPHQRGDQASKRNSQRSHLSPPLQPSFPRDDINDSRRRGSNGSHRRAAERLSLYAPNQCALVLRPKNLCDSVTLLGIGECAMNFTGGLILIAIGIVMLFFGRARKGEQLRIFRVWIVGQLYAMTAMTLGVFGVAALIVNWPF